MSNYVKTNEITDLVKIEMASGSSMVVKLDPTNAPITVKNFQKLVAAGFYNGLIYGEPRRITVGLRARF